jgi:hypothetical protein
MAVRLDPADEYMHELGPESNFNESMYVNVFDPAGNIGGWFRIGNRANEHHAEMTVCIYLPDGRVAFMFNRAHIEDNSKFDAAGMTWTMVKPFEELTVSYTGQVLVLKKPLDMADPKRAFANNPQVPCEVRLTFTGQGRASMFGGEPDTPHEKPGEEFAKGHYEQLIAGSGTIKVGDETFTIDGLGLRDHSWGPRFWSAPWYYRWLTGNVDRNHGFMLSRVARRDGDGTRGGFVWEDGQMHYCDSATVETVTTGFDSYHQDILATLSSSRSGKSWQFTGEVMNLIPLRNRRTGPDGNEYRTRISEGMTRWTMADGRVGFGLSEYLDQMIEGQPVGIDE